MRFYEKSIQKIIIIVAIIGSGRSLHAMDSKKLVKDAPFSMYEMPKKVVKGYTQAYTTAFSITFMHEFGHWIANKTLLGRKGIIFVNPFQILPLGGGFMHSYKDSLIQSFKELLKSKNMAQTAELIKQKNIIQPGIRSALMSLAGPLFGYLVAKPLNN